MCGAVGEGASLRAVKAPRVLTTATRGFSLSRHPVFCTALSPSAYVSSFLVSLHADICGALKWGFAETEAALQRLVLEQIGGSGFTDTETSLFSSGTTACVALLQHNTLYVASLGDSRCIISRAGRAVPLTEDHHLRTNRKEQARVRAAGGSYDDEGYLNGVLAVSRAFGGFSKQTGEKLMGLSSEPDVNVHHIRKEDEFLLLACDGIFDVLTSQECVSLVRSKLRAGDSPFTASQQLAELAMQRYSLDNLSVVVVVLQSPNKEPDREREGWWGEEGDSEEQCPSVETFDVRKQSEGASPIREQYSPCRVLELLQRGGEQWQGTVRVCGRIRKRYGLSIHPPVPAPTVAMEMGWSACCIAAMLLAKRVPDSVATRHPFCSKFFRVTNATALKEDSSQQELPAHGRTPPPPACCSQLPARWLHGSEAQHNQPQEEESMLQHHQGEFCRPPPHLPDDYWSAFGVCYSLSPSEVTLEADSCLYTPGAPPKSEFRRLFPLYVEACMHYLNELAIGTEGYSNALRKVTQGTRFVSPRHATRTAPGQQRGGDGCIARHREKGAPLGGPPRQQPQEELKKPEGGL
ncbi:protein phosphatase [Cyclospora cayetanensis]|uniref:Protein phosphatase n=1 Tax=Cyclospora cayetanensis TaxID=88456 RepID=A0A1D3CRK5_9EIME|nr:protein phosphatase [Cyclospora cayetanensis]